MSDFVLCSNCKKETHKYEVFPKGLCLACYEVTPEANAPLTAQGITQMFIKSVNL